MNAIVLLMATETKQEQTRNENEIFVNLLPQVKYDILLHTLVKVWNFMMSRSVLFIENNWYFHDRELVPTNIKLWLLDNDRKFLWKLVFYTRIK